MGESKSGAVRDRVKSYAGKNQQNADKHIMKIRQPAKGQGNNQLIQKEIWNHVRNDSKRCKH